MRAINIEWDVGEYKEALDTLPTEMQIPAGVHPDDVEDWLSDKTGWCMFGFKLVPDEHIFEAKIKQLPFLGDMWADWKLYRLTSPADLADVCMTLYGDAIMRRIDKMQDEKYPCWAIFSIDAEGEGRCEGTLDIIHDKCMSWLQDTFGKALEEMRRHLVPGEQENYEKDDAMRRALQETMPGVILGESDYRKIWQAYEKITVGRRESGGNEQ